MTEQYEKAVKIKDIIKYLNQKKIKHMIIGKTLKILKNNQWSELYHIARYDIFTRIDDIMYD